MQFDQIVNDFKDLKSFAYHKVWEPFMRKYDCNIICELGVEYGYNFLPLIAHEPKIAVAIDSWVDDKLTSRNVNQHNQEYLDKMYSNFKNQMKHKPYVKLIRDYTYNAVKQFEDNYFDFVYIDADHTFEACYKDILDWYPKVKSGKFLVGHDYIRRFGVIPAVNKFIEENKLELIRFGFSNWAVIKH